MKILIDDSALTNGRPRAHEDPNRHTVNEDFSFPYEGKTVNVHNIDVYWADQKEIRERLQKWHGSILDSRGYAVIGNGIVGVNKSRTDDEISVQVHAY